MIEGAVNPSSGSGEAQTLTHGVPALSMSHPNLPVKHLIVQPSNHPTSS